MITNLFSQLSLNRLPAMDHIAAVAMKHFGVPMSVVSLVTSEEVVFVGAQGLPHGYVPKDTNFCRLVASGPDVIVIEDTLSDPRLRTNSAVVGPPRIRFFAGAPLVAETGENLGTVCIADVRPRQLEFGQRVALKHMARIAAQEWIDRRSRTASAFAF
jgi:GAF domain-containing protein